MVPNTNSKCLACSSRVGLVHQNIIKENKYKLPQIGLENKVHKPWESGWGISETKRHY